MIKRYIFFKFPMLLFGLIFSFFPAEGQIFTIGSGALSNDDVELPTPYGNNFFGNRTQMIYRASELTAAGASAGLITAISFQVDALNGVSALNDFEIKIKNSTNNNLLSGWETGFTTVFSSSSYTPTPGWNSHQFFAPFFWNGTSHIIVEICSQNITSTTGGNASVFWTTGLPSGTSISYSADVFGVCSSTIIDSLNHTHRPNAQFTIISDTCTTPVSIGLLDATSTLVCSGVPTTIFAPNMTIGLSQSYQWQSSFDSISWSNIPGATGASYVASWSNDLFYRLQVTCGMQTTTSTPIKISIGSDPMRGVYTINQLLPTSGTNFTSFADFKFALDCAGVDSAVVVDIVPNSGPYNEQILFEEIAGVSAANTVTINGNGNTLTHLSNVTNARYTLGLDGTSWLIVDSLRIVAEGSLPNEFGWGVWMTGGAEHNALKNCVIQVDTTSNLVNFAGVVLSGLNNDARPNGGSNFGSYNTIENNTIIGGYFGLTCMGNNASNQGVENKIINNTISHFFWHGAYFRAQEDLVVKGNTITRGSRTLTTNAPFYGMYFNTAFENCEITHNRIFKTCENCSNYSGQQYGVYFNGANGSAGKENVLANNLITDFNGNGSWYGVYVSNSDFWQFYHNHIVLDDSNSTSLISTGFYVTSMSQFDNCEIKNNLISVDKSAGTTLGINFNTDNNTWCDYNAVYVPNGSVGRFLSTSYTTMADWQAGTNFDPNGQGAAPLFIDPSNFDYTPGSSALSGQGTNLLSVVPDDYFGVARSTPPDIGAIEFAPLPCMGTFNFENDSLTPTSGFFSWGSIDSNWVIEYGPLGFSPGDPGGTRVGASNNLSFEVTGLTSMSCYDFYVAEVCVSDTSVWEGPVTVCTPKANDAELLGFVSPIDRDCGDANMEISVELRNNAYFSITSVPITVEITGAITQTITTTYTGNLTMGNTDVVSVGTVDLSDGGNINLMAYVNLPNDQDLSNDTVAVSDVRIIPEEPQINFLPFCANDSMVTLFGENLPQLATYGWYDSIVGGNLLSNNDTITVPVSDLPNIWLGYETIPLSPGNRNYCSSGAISTIQNVISNVSFGSINNTSGMMCATYTDFTNFSTPVEIGQSYPISIEVQSCASPNVSASTKVFIDFNGNGDFTDPGEEVLGLGGHGIGIISGFVAIPASATAGLTTTMRVVTVGVNNHASINPCGQYTFGETEDYTIDILGPQACNTIRVQSDAKPDSLPIASFTYNILPNLEVEFINTSSPAGLTANWDFGGQGTATGDTVTFIFPETDTFNVCLHVIDSCSDQTCKAINVYGIGIQSHTLKNFKVFPNPNEGRFTLSFSQIMVSDLNIELLDISGKIVFHEIIRDFSGDYNKTFDQSKLASGSYMLRVRNRKGVVTKHIVINN
ncbi:MAG: T9SS type A sorting domain-containing protein [Cryomorphaceae bacterium]|nr:T9SS type A sorting domain-containing protein [Cryomorphaceae bacterium]